MYNKKESEIDYEELYNMEKSKNEKYKIENKYLLAQINIYNNNKYNKGEKSEILLIMKLFYLNETKQYDKLINIFGKEACNGIKIICCESNVEILDINSIVKTNNKYKADCII